jgi:hypothetical protein
MHCGDRERTDLKAMKARRWRLGRRGRLRLGAPDQGWACEQRGTGKKEGTAGGLHGKTPLGFRKTG